MEKHEHSAATLADINATRRGGNGWVGRVAALLVVVLAASACATEVPGEGDESSEEDGDGIEEEQGETSSELQSSALCSNLCGAGTVVACARFGFYGGVACGLGSIAVCAGVCREARTICNPGFRRVRTTCFRSSCNWACRRI